jgi:hypothetical protein
MVDQFQAKSKSQSKGGRVLKTGRSFSKVPEEGIGIFAAKSMDFVSGNKEFKE